MLRDLRHALRTLARTPGYTIAVILTLALGIGGTAAVFSVLRSVILRPFSWAPADRVMMIAEQDSATNVRPASYPTFQDWRNGDERLRRARVRARPRRGAEDGRGAERLVGAFVTDEYFRVLPEPAALGPHARARRTSLPARRPSRPSRGRSGSAGFGGDRSVLGRSVTLGEQSYTIVGVMPRSSSTRSGPTSGHRSPPSSPPAPPSSSVACIPTVASWAASARAWTRRPVSGRSPRWPRTWPRRIRRRTAAGGRVTFLPVAAEILGGTGPQLRLLTVAAIFVLLIACVNVAAPHAGPSGARSRELAIRTALGGGRGTLLRLLAAECVVLGVAAGSARARRRGVAGGLASGRRPRPAAPRRASSRWIPGRWSRPSRCRSRSSSCWACSRRFALASLLGYAPRGLGRGRRTRRVAGCARRSSSGEIALALVLLTGAGLLMRSLERLQRGAHRLRRGAPAGRPDHAALVPVREPRARAPALPGRRRGPSRPYPASGPSRSPTTCRSVARRSTRRSRWRAAPLARPTSGALSCGGYRLLPDDRYPDRARA